MIYAEWNCISRVCVGNGDVVAAYPARVGSEGLSLEDPLSGRLHKEGGEAESFFFAATIQTQFFERPSDQKRAAKKEEGSASWSGSQEALSVRGLSGHTH